MILHSTSFFVCFIAFIRILYSSAVCVHAHVALDVFDADVCPL